LLTGGIVEGWGGKARGKRGLTAEGAEDAEKERENKRKKEEDGGD
jgi:hypothetical protein